VNDAYAGRQHLEYMYSTVPVLASIDSRQMILRRGVRAITISCINNASTLPNTCQLISVELRPYPARAVLVVQYRVALWGQRWATYVRRAISYRKVSQREDNLRLRSGGF
jgi:hypothetical protein